MPSLALIFHLIEVAGGKASGLVSKEAAVMAAQWCAYLETHARRVYGLIANLPDKIASRLADKIKRGKLPESFTARGVHRHGWELLDDPKLVAEACEDLVEADWLRAVLVPPSDRGGRGTVQYLINPAVSAKGKDADSQKALTWGDLI